MSHNKPIGCGASGVYAPGTDDEEEEQQQIKINIHKRNNTKTQYKKYKTQ